MIEAVIVGHLPVLASAWVSQIARLRASEQRRPVGLVRIQAGHVSVEVFGGTGLSLTPADTVTEAIERAARACDHWLLAADETLELDVATVRGVSAVTFLTAATDIAVVACYRAIKGFASRLAEMPEDDAGPAIRALVLGGPEDRAAEAAERLRKTTAAYLSRHLEVEPLSIKIGPGRSMTMARVAEAVAPGAIVDTIRAQRPATNTASGSPEGVGGGPASAAAVIEPKPGPAVKIAGLTLVAPRCPHAAGVEFALDAAGGLHLICAAGTVGGGRSVESAMAELAAAAGWARANAGLFAAAVAGLKSSPAAQLCSHLVTDAPKDARRLLDADVRVHAAIPAGAGDWAVVELN